APAARPPAPPFKGLPTGWLSFIVSGLLFTMSFATRTCPDPVEPLLICSCRSKGIAKRAKEPQPAICRRLVASRNLCSRFLPHAIQRRVQGVRAFAESLAFFLRHVRLEHLDHAATADDARQGQRDAKLLLIAADRNDRALVIEHHLGDTGRYDPDSFLASIMAFDDGDVRIAPLSLQLMLQLANPLAAPLEQCRHWNSADPCRGPQEHLRGSVVANHL